MCVFTARRYLAVHQLKSERQRRSLLTRSLATRATGHNELTQQQQFTRFTKVAEVKRSRYQNAGEVHEY